MEDIAFHLERESGHAPKSIADIFVDVWKKTLVASVVPCFLSWHSPLSGFSACGILVTKMSRGAAWRFGR